MDDPEQLSRLIGAIYDAALHPEAWVGVLESACAYFDGPAAMIFWQDSTLAVGERYYSWGDDPAHTQSYFDEYIKLSPTIDAQQRLPVGEVASVSGLLGGPLRQGRFYEEWMRPQGYVDNVFVNLDRSPTSAATFAVVRGEHNGPADAADLRRMELLAPHVRRAVLISKLIDVRKLETAAFARLLESAAAGVFLVDQHGSIVQRNQRADAMLQDGDVVSPPAGQLHTIDHGVNREIIASLSAGLLGDMEIGHRGISLPLNGRSGKAYVVHLLPLNGPQRRGSFDDRRALGAVFIREAKLDTGSGLAMLAQHHRLTPREVEVARGIVDIGGVPEVATALGISARTVRTHLQSVFAKTGAARQADLVRLVAGFAVSR